MLFALRKSEVGAAFVDWFTPLHLGLGFAAGGLGLNPHLAAILFVGARTAKLAAEEGLGHALFSIEHGQSHANELTDLTAEFLGLYLGGKARQMITGHAPAAHGLGGKIVGMGSGPMPRMPIAGSR
jgi:hypothetical protein